MWISPKRRRDVEQRENWNDAAASGDADVAGFSDRQFVVKGSRSRRRDANWAHHSIVHVLRIVSTIFIYLRKLKH